MNKCEYCVYRVFDICLLDCSSFVDSFESCEFFEPQNDFYDFECSIECELMQEMIRESIKEKESLLEFDSEVF